MKQGDQIRIIREHDQPPLLSQVTKKVAALVAAGFKFGGTPGPDGQTKAYLDTTETKADGSTARTVTWAFDARGQHTFRPMAAAETVDLPEFWRRLGDEDWLRSNPDHPISYVAATLLQLDRLQKKMQSTERSEELGEPLVRHILIRKGKRKAYLPAHLPAEEKTRLLKKMKML